MANVTIIEPTIRPVSIDGESAARKLRVAAYARVSTELDEQQNSYEAQVNFYTSYIKSNSGWDFAGIYSDEGISGTSYKNRDGFNRMIADAKAGKIDLILTKSISRFSRNVVDALTVTRELKSIGVEVRFEKENISSFDPKSEMVFAIMSSLAQEESRSISENVKWGHRRSMEEGKVHVAYSRFLGYTKGKDGKLEIVPEEAAVVKQIYDDFLNGMTISNIAKKLTTQGVKTPAGKSKWAISTVRSILSNEKYKGDALLQKTYTADYLTKQTKKNDGELPQYYVKNSHPAIIAPDIFDLVQYELAKRGKNKESLSNNSPFTTKIICGDCGHYYGRKVYHSNDKYRNISWCCNHKYAGEAPCKTPRIREDDLKAAYRLALGQELARIAATAGLGGLSQAEEAAEFQRLKEAREAAARALEVAIEELRLLMQDNARKAQNQAQFMEKYNKLTARVTDRKAALHLAEEAILSHTAKKEKLRRFQMATAELDPNDIDLTDDLIMATCEKIAVGLQTPEGFCLVFDFLNDGKVTINIETTH